jgi:hypothetical protein
MKPVQESAPGMKEDPETMTLSKRALQRGLFALNLAVVLSLAAATSPSRIPERIPAAEFARIIQEFSEPGGFFQSDNFVSNENAYLSVVNKMRDLGASGGAYIGVGPEQNFTYIARIHPTIAFIVDIRRQAMIQHLMYKAIFHLSENRAQFLAHLFSRPLTAKDAPGAEASVNELMAYFSRAPADASAFKSNLSEIEHTINSSFKFPLAQTDRSTLEYVYRAFYTDGVSISFQFGPGRGRYSRFSTMSEIVEQLDPDGKPGNFLASPKDYRFVRELQEKNRIIPVVGDFAGGKALKAIARYLRQHSCSVTAFYTSNVEQFLFMNDTFALFVDNVRALPITPGSLFIRSVANMWRSPVPGTRMATLLQYISTFIKDYDDDLYLDYWTLVNTHSIPLH